MRYINKYILLPAFIILFAGCSEEVGDIELFLGTEEVEVITLDNVRYRIDETYTEEVDKGLKYTFIQIKNEKLPMVAHVIEFDLLENPALKVETCIGKDSLRGLETPSAMAQRKSVNGKDVLVAINGGFFNTNSESIPEHLRNIPLGGEVASKMVVHDPDWDWQPSIWFDNSSSPSMGSVEFGGSVIAANNVEIAITGVNRFRDSGFMILFNSYNGVSTRANTWGGEVLLKPVEGDWETLSSYQNVKCEVIKKEIGVHTGTDGNMAIPKGHIVLSGHGVSNTFLENNVFEGDIITVNASMKSVSDGSLLPDIENLVCAQSIILRSGTVQTIDNSINTATHPRTAVGYSSSGTKIYFVVVEGRLEGRSIGLTTKQLAGVLLYMGAANGVNLDGGGSSCMVVNKKIVNQLSDGSERAVIDGLLIVKE